MKIIGIDLGTANTYVYGSEQKAARAQGAQEPRPLFLPQICAANGSMATAVLYENDRPIAIGNIAESEFHINRERQGARRLVSQFKPEIGRGAPDVTRWMTDFLLLLRQALPAGYLEEDSEIYAGMPALAREDFSLNLGDCFVRAGWPRPSFVRESDAALVSCLQSGALDIDDIAAKCLILDFGGGTCDYTVVEDMEILQNGGDLLYGGRLFDDLFFQVFCRQDKEFAREAPVSPAAWHIHWIECREQKEAFSDFILQAKARDEERPACTLHAAWLDRAGKRHDVYVPGYSCDNFIRDAENYEATGQMLEMLASYGGRGGLSQTGADLLRGRQVGLMNWMKLILGAIAGKRDMAKIILTGGSGRWFFVSEYCREIFPNAKCVPSRRGYEDIAFGLALFPLLAASRERVARLLEEKLPQFSRKASGAANEIVQRSTAAVVDLCASRIVERDIMPVLDAAQKKSMSIGELERACAANIQEDQWLLRIVREKSETLRQEVQRELSHLFANWLRANGVLLVPTFDFPAKAIGDDFFASVSVKLSELDALKLTRLALMAMLPLLAGAAAAHFLAPLGEPISLLTGAGLTGWGVWLAAKTTPALLERQKLPKFLLTEKNRRKLADKNRQLIEKELKKDFALAQAHLMDEIEKRLNTALRGMLGRLTVLNQVKTA